MLQLETPERGRTGRRRIQRAWRLLVMPSVLVAALAVALGVLSVAYEFRAAQARARETQAIEYFVRFEDIRRGLPSQQSPELAVWRRNVTIALAESIWKLRGDEPRWRIAVEWMLDREIESGGAGDPEAAPLEVICASYAGDFRALLERKFGPSVCVELKEAAEEEPDE